MYPFYYLQVDLLYNEQVGGFTTSPGFIENNLAVLGLEKLSLIERGGRVKFPVVVLAAGGYICIIQFNQGFIKPRMGFVHHQVSIEQYFDYFADGFSPKTVQAIFDTQAKIKAQTEAYRHSIKLTLELLAE